VSAVSPDWLAVAPLAAKKGVPRLCRRGDAPDALRADEREAAAAASNGP